MLYPEINTSDSRSSIPDIIRRYLMPGFIFQSVVIAGGYGTGRELAEFFLPYGPRGGLIAMVFVSMTFWSLVCVVAFEYARVFQAYDYRTFCRNLLGRGWIIFELTYSVLLIVVFCFFRGGFFVAPGGGPTPQSKARGLTAAAEGVGSYPPK